MSGQTMTIREIADLCETDKTTVQRWIKRIDDAKRIEIDAKCTEADATKKPARFDLREVLAIINAGGKHTMAALLAENAKSHESHTVCDSCDFGQNVRRIRPRASGDYGKRDSA